MHRLHPKYIRIAGIIIVSLLILLLIGGFIAYSKREALLQSAISKAKLKAKREYNLDVKIGSAYFTGLATVSLSDITIVPSQRDSLLNIKRFDVSVKLLPLIFGNIKLANVVLDDGHLNLTNIKGVKNFDFLFKRKKDTTENKKGDLSALAYRLINSVLYKIPDNLDVTNFLFTFVNDSTRFKLFTQTASIKDGFLNSTINVNDGAATWHFAGKMHPSDKEIDVKLYADKQKVELPYMEKKYRLKVNFDTISTRLEKVEHSEGITRIYGSWAVHNLLINHPGLSSNDIIIPDGSINANVFVGENYVSLDSSSVIHLKKLVANPYLKYTLRPVKIYEAKVHTGWQNAQDIFDSFPQGIFESLDGIQVAGKLNYNFNFYLDNSKPDDLQFDSRLDKDNNFKVIKYGKNDLSRLNGDFVYTPYEFGKPMAAHYIGSKNPEFTPLADISPNLRNAVMTAEDPTFYHNRGFVEESLRKSLITDFKEKKFKRGGSTISMQLVKNSFLTRQKTLSRKIEEILIVWMIENNHIMSKNRMLEVYFNIIEWGRGIYGISEASHYYFGKSPSELTLGESIYLASIVPHPKTGLYSFLPDGTLRPGLQGYFNSLGRMMTAGGLTPVDSAGYGYSSVRLREGLRREIAPVTPAVADSLMRQQNDDDDTPVVAPEPEKKPNFFQRLFGKKDTTAKKEKEIIVVDTAGKTKKEIRQEKRRLKKEEKERQKEYERELKEKAKQQ